MTLNDICHGEVEPDIEIWTGSSDYDGSPRIKIVYSGRVSSTEDRVLYEMKPHVAFNLIRKLTRALEQST